jgi:hypothetical protein
MIRFETFQYISFVLACSLFIYMSISIVTWWIKEVKPKKPGPLARFGKKEH